MPPTLAEYQAQKQQKAQQDYANGIMTPQNGALDPWSGTTDANNTWTANTPEQAAAAYAQLYNQGYGQNTANNSGSAGTGGLPSNWQSSYTGPSAAMVGWTPDIQQYAANNSAGYTLPSNYSAPTAPSGNISGGTGTGGLSSLMSQQQMYSGAQPTTNPLQSFIGGNTNPYAGSTNPYLQAANVTTAGNLAGAQTATQANRVNQNTLYGGLNYQQGVDQYGNPTWTANQTGTPQTQNLVNSSLAGLQASLNNPMYGINPGQTYSDAIMQRLQPQMAQQSQSNTAALANQGIVPGTQAYNNAMRTFQQGQNDQLTSAVIGGMNTGLQAQQLQNTQAGQIKSLTTPNLINAPTQAAVAGPDYTGAVASQTAAEIAANNARLGQQTANTAGLYGLGSAGILGAAANPGLVSSGLNGIGSGISSAYNWLNTPSYSSPTDYMSSAGLNAGSFTF